MRNRYRHTKIVFTVGPATEEASVLEALIRSGVDVCRLNMAHASPAWVRTVVGRVREASAAAGRSIAVMMDIKGPEIRTAALGEPITLKEGDTFEFTTSPATAVSAGARGVSVNYQRLHEDLRPGDTVLVDSGLLRFRVIASAPGRVRTTVLVGGQLGSRRHLNLPGIHIHLPSLTEKDKRNIELGVEVGVDFFALSFVREATDIDALRAVLAHAGSPARIVAKIEDQSGLRNIAEIVRATDAVMIARGDLGIETPFEELPLVQLEIGKACLAQGKPFIIATQLLESMVESPMPTRAEITDVANAVQELADAVMLSGETAVGRFPLECVGVMNKIIDRTEPTTGQPLNGAIELRDGKTKMLRSAAYLAKDVAGAIVVFTKTGYLPAVLAALRPDGVPIFAFTDREAVFRQLLLYWGVEPFFMPFSDDPETAIKSALAELVGCGWRTPGEEVVVITNALAHDEIIDTIQLRTIAPQ